MVYMVKTDHQINKSFRLLCKTGRYFFTRLLILEKIWSWIVANNKQFSVCYFFLTSNICNVKSLIRIFQQNFRLHKIAGRYCFIVRNTEHDIHEAIGRF